MVICMGVSSVLFLIFFYLFLTAGEKLSKILLLSKTESVREDMKNCQNEIRLIVADAKQHPQKVKKLKKQAQKKKKQADELEKQLKALGRGRLPLSEMIILAGYRVIQLLKWDASSPQIKKINQQCVQFREKKEAVNYSYYVVASLIGYSLFGAAAGFLLLAAGLAGNLGSRSLILGGMVWVVFFLLGYLKLDGVNSTVKKRAEEIERQFPQAISKMTLLVSAGLEVNQAWKLTSESSKGVLYEEMRRVLIDFDNNVAPGTAYSKFIDRCSNKFTTKLATAIIQNMSKGNAEIIKLFRTLNDESWMERKHSARRMGEMIQSKLLVPTLLMFMGILVLVIVPVLSGFNMM